MFVDYTDFCRSCGGKGSIPEKTERGTTLHEDCWQCGGTGYRTVRVTKKPEVAHAQLD